MSEHEKNLVSVSKMGAELVAKASDQGPRLQADLDSLNSEWTAVVTGLEQRQSRLDKSIANVTEFMVSCCHRVNSDVLSKNRHLFIEWKVVTIELLEES